MKPSHHYPRFAWLTGRGPHSVSSCPLPLRLVLTLPFVLQTLGAGALVGYLVYRNGQQSVAHLSHQLMEEVGDRTILYLETTFALPHQVNQLNADAIEFELIPGFESRNTEALERFFLRQISRFPTVSTIAIANERGGMVGSGQQNPRASVYRTQDFAQGTYSLEYVDRQGNVVSSTTVSQNYDARSRPWYQAPKQAGRAVWSPIYTYVATRPILGISAGLPVYDAAGNLEGVLATDITLEHLQQFLASLDISPSGQVFILERSGLLVASSTHQPPFIEQAGQLERVNAANSTEPILRETVAALINEIGSLKRIQAPQQLEVNQGSTRQFVQVMPFRDPYGLDWLIVTVVPESDFTAAIQANARRTAILAGLALLGSLGLGLWVARHITQPAYQRDLERQVVERTQALRESQTQLQTITDSIPGCISYVDATCRYRFVNHTYEIWFQRKKEEILGKTVEEVIGKTAYQRLRHYIERALAGENIVYEAEVPYVGNHTRYISAVLVPDRDPENRVQGYYALVTDISDRKQVEAALQQSEQLFRGAFETSAFGISIRAPEGQYLRVNPALCRILGYSEAELLALNYQDITIPDDLQIDPKNTLDRLVSGELSHYHLEKRYRHKDGHIVWALVSLSLVRDLQQQPLYFVAQVQDISDRKRAEAALRESEERFRSAFQGAPIGMALIDLDNRWFKVNPTLCKMLGYRESELLSQNALTVVHPDDAPLAQHYIDQVRNNTCEGDRIEIRYSCKDGRTSWGLLSLSLVRDAQEQPFYYVAQLQDNTEQHTIDRMKTEFISIVSHELRTPLTAIQGFLGLLNTGIYDDRPARAKRMLEQALRNSERLTRLVNDILDLERLTSGKVQLSLETCDAYNLMHQAVAEFQPIADQSSITLAVIPPTPESPPLQVWAAPDAILQTLTNLLSNAIKFSPASSQVTLAAQAQPNQVLFSVNDQGRGIPADKLESIFGRFQQVDVSDARQKGGTGLGLAICQSIIQQHGGSIWVESAPGEGSTFYFTLATPPLETP